MNILNLIPGGRIGQAIALAALCAALIGGVAWGVHSYNESLREEGRGEVRTAMNEQMQAQRDRNIELQRAAEKKYTVAAEVRDRFITRTVTEVRNATVSLASCPVGADAVRLLNNAARCAGEDRPASCGAGDEVQPPK